MGVGNHTLTYTITNNGCTLSSSLVVRVAGFPNIALTLPDTICNFDPIGGVISGVSTPVRMTVYDHQGNLMLQSNNLADLTSLRTTYTTNIKVVVEDLMSSCVWTNVERIVNVNPNPAILGYVNVRPKLIAGFTLNEPSELQVPGTVSLTNTTQMLSGGGNVPQPLAPGLNLVYTINWGDGSAPSVVTNLTSISHDYADASASPATISMSVRYLASATACASDFQQNLTLVRGLRPNVITPNGDNVNDALVFDGMAGEAVLRIFNRYGVQVHEETTISNAWNGANLASGTYFYRLVRSNGQELKGWVEVMR